MQVCADLEIIFGYRRCCWGSQSQAQNPPRFLAQGWWCENVLRSGLQ